MRFAHALALAALRIERPAGATIAVLVAHMRLGSAVLDILSSVTVIHALPQICVERLQGVRLDSCDRRGAEDRTYVLVGLADVVAPRARRNIDRNLEVAIEQLIQGCRCAGGAPLVDLTLKPRERLLGMLLGVRPRRDRLSEVDGFLRDRIHSGVDTHPIAAAAFLDVASSSACHGSRHMTDRTRLHAQSHAQ